MLQTKGVRVAIVLKQYDDGRVTGAIRCNQGTPIAAKLAETLGGGGHPYASGFKVTSGKTSEQIKQSCIESAEQLLATLEQM
jgi:nanoRNase/pAp phosphatase (c-di-AMP/oligoRNAs hydrolase)